MTQSICLSGWNEWKGRQGRAYSFIGVTHYSDGEGALVHSTVKERAPYDLGVTHYSDGEDRQGA